MAIKQEIIDKYKNLDWQKLLRKNLGEAGELNSIEQNLQRIKTIIDRIFSYQLTLEQIPNYERTFENVLNNLIQELNSQIIDNYSDVNQKESKLAFVRQKEESIISQLNPVLTYLQFADPANDVRQKDLEKKSKQLEDNLKTVDELTKKVKKSVDISGTIAEGQEVKLYGKEFERMAEGEFATKEVKFFRWPIFYLKKYSFLGNKQKANRNSFGMFSSLIFTALMACIFVFGKHLVIEGDGTFFQKLWNTILEQNVLLKLVIISAGGYLVAHFSRNYSAEMNMYYVNKHRQLTLNSHQRILDSVRGTESNNDAETKNAILLQVTRTMFDVQETGYLKNGTSPVPTTQIIETIRSGTGK
jgi:hypothetical protein